jgi:hypothetical protein
MQGKDMVITKMTIHNFFISRVRSMLHCVLAMSPIGEAFRNRLRMFPSLVNPPSCDINSPSTQLNSPQIHHELTMNSL